jgi:homoserine dehydrogenase
MKIGLLGFGTVGQGVYELCCQREDMSVAWVFCRREVQLENVRVTHDFQDILNDSSVDTVVEVIGGLHPAADYVLAALRAGKNVVTANKAMMAACYAEILEACRQSGARIRCTAAVGGGIGWLPALERACRVETIGQISGIMNGTCNYILDSMTRLGLQYREALSQAQAFGYAEADPTADVDGIDTWNKLILSANIAFGVSLDRAQVPVAGISTITAEDVAAFSQRGYVCKLLGRAKVSGGCVEAFVQPTLVGRDQLEAAVPSNHNLITYVGNTSGRQSFFGQGAGRYPTAYNVLQDLQDLRSGKGFYQQQQRPMPVRNLCKAAFYVRGPENDWLRANTAERWSDGIVTSGVTVEAMHAYLAAHPGAFIAALPERKDQLC